MKRINVVLSDLTTFALVWITDPIIVLNPFNCLSN
jgi:hypothetical protein